MKPTFCAIFLAGVAASVDAHGFLYTVTIDGKRYIGDVPNRNTNPSTIRQVSNVTPVKGASNPDINCGLSAKIASLVADANPGSNMIFNWSGGDFQHVRLAAVLSYLIRINFSCLTSGRTTQAPC